MPRLATLALLLLPATAVAQPKADAPAAGQPDVRPLTVTAAAAPVPALRYALLPPLRDRTPGNAAVGYHRAALLRPPGPRDDAEAKAREERIARWEDAPLDKLPAAEVAEFLKPYAPALRALDLAARNDRCDWQLAATLAAGEDVAAILPEVQANRELMRYLRLRLRAELAGDRFDDAAKSLQTGFQLGKHVAEGPTLIQMLVGIALTAIATNDVERFIARPDAPNLYWGLTTLPRPLIDPWPALEGEGAFFHRVFPELDQFDRGPLSTERANELLQSLVGNLQNLGGGRPGENPWAGTLAAKVGLAGYVALQHTAAKAELVARGRAAADVERMPAAQAVALASALRIRDLSDDQRKTFALPPPLARAELAKVSARAKKMLADNRTDPIFTLFAMTLPAVEKVYDAHQRTDRRLAALRAVEAVRMHAAAHDGRPPAALAEVTLVPVPDDPLTGKPFAYAATGLRFTLDALPADGTPAHRGNSFRYEVTLREGK